MGNRIYVVEGTPVIEVEGDDGSMWFRVTSVENLPAIAPGCEDEWVAYLAPVSLVPEIKLKG